MLLSLCTVHVRLASTDRAWHWAYFAELYICGLYAKLKFFFFILTWSIHYQHHMSGFFARKSTGKWTPPTPSTWRPVSRSNSPESGTGQVDTTTPEDNDGFKGHTPVTRNRYSIDARLNSESITVCRSTWSLTGIIDALKDSYGVQAATNLLSSIPLAFASHDIAGFVCVQISVNPGQQVTHLSSIFIGNGEVYKLHYTCSWV
jgi:hypothetical protein